MVLSEDARSAPFTNGSGCRFRCYFSMTVGLHDLGNNLLYCRSGIAPLPGRMRTIKMLCLLRSTKILYIYGDFLMLLISHNILKIASHARYHDVKIPLGWN